MTAVEPWYPAGTRAIAGDFYEVADYVREVDRAVLLREYPSLNTAGTVANRMKALVPDDCTVHLTARKVPAGPLRPERVGVFAFTSGEQLGRLLTLRDYAGAPVGEAGE